MIDMIWRMLAGLKTFWTTSRYGRYWVPGAGYLNRYLSSMRSCVTINIYMCSLPLFYLSNRRSCVTAISSLPLFYEPYVGR